MYSSGCFTVFGREGGRKRGGGEREREGEGERRELKERFNKSLKNK